MRILSAIDSEENRDRFSFYILSFLFTIFAITFFVLPTQAAHGADRYWVGPSNGKFNTSSNWATTSGGSGGASIPGASDKAIFDSGATTVAEMNISTEIGELLMDTGYTATLTTKSSLTVNGDVTVKEGSLDLVYASNNALSTNGGSLIVNGANAKVAATSSSRISIGKNLELLLGKIDFTGVTNLSVGYSPGGASSTKVVMSGGNYLAANQNDIDTDEFDLTGVSNFNHNNGEFSLSSPFAEGMSVTTSGKSFYDIHVFGSVVTLNDSMNIVNNLKIGSAYSATFDPNGNDVFVAGDTIFRSDGSYTIDNSKLVLNGAGNQKVTSSGKFLPNLKIAHSSASATTTLQDDLTVSGTLEVATGTFNSNNNTVTISGITNITGSNAVYKSGSSVQNLNGGLAISNGSFEQESAKIDFNYSDWNQTGGNFLGGSSSLMNVNSFSLSGGVVTSTSGILDLNSVDINGGNFNHNNANEIRVAGNVTSSGAVFNNLSFGRNTVLSDNLSVENRFWAQNNVSSFNLNSKQLNLSGDFVLSWDDIFDANNGTVKLEGGGQQDITTNNNALFNLKLAHSSLTATTTLQDALTVSGTLEVATGTLKDGGNNITIKGDWNNSGSNIGMDLTGKTIFAGSGNQKVTSSGESFNEIQVAQSSVSDTTTLQDALTVSGTLEVATGTLDTKSKNTTISSDLNFNGGSVASTSKSSLTVSGDSIASLPNGTISDLFDANILTPQGGNEASTVSSSFNYSTVFNKSGEKVEFASSSVLTLADTNTKKDFRKIGVQNSISSNLPSNATERGGIQFGLSDADLTVDQTATITMAVSGVSNGTSLDIYQKKASGDWKDSGKDCTVSSNKCIFTTKSFSEFAAVTVQSTSSGNSTSGGGGASLLLTQNKPEISSGSGMEINGGANSTESREILVSFNVDNADKVALSEDKDFAGVSFETLPDSQEMSFRLSSGNGEKTVYAKLQSSNGTTLTLSDKINLSGFNSSVVCTMQYAPVCGEDGKTYSNRCVAEQQNNVKVEHEGKCDGSGSDIAAGMPIKSANDNSVGMTVKEDDQLKIRWFKTSEKYFSYFDSWSEVNVVSDSTMSKISESKLGFMPWGPKREFKNGTLMKTVTDPKVYLINGSYKNWIESEEVFEALGYDWDMIMDVSESALDQYTEGWEIDYTDHHPPYTLIKYSNSSKVYKLEPNESDELEKRHIANEEVFESLNYRWSSIIEIDQSETYPTGEPITN